MYCMGPLGDIRGPYKMSMLKQYNELAAPFANKFKVWKIGQCEKDRVSLPGACCLVSTISTSLLSLFLQAQAVRTSPSFRSKSNWRLAEYGVHVSSSFTWITKY
ncbi:uncharacterized protein [Spinacia oleracea]|uniref:GYF domain-containing protein n=1 Tax=Spinacia oleracea TaxID=3562 RepID=A0ABM3QT32_SPIOL|nr:uncharacterized protein LOC130462396 [Spinacia oleracea]